MSWRLRGLHPGRCGTRRFPWRTELRFHLQGALNHGVTIEELEELMITVIGYVGFPTAVEGFRALREIEARQPSTLR